MAILRAQPPTGLERAVLDTAAELLPARLGAAGGHGPSLAGEVIDMADRTTISDVWPLYHLGLQQIVEGSGLAGAAFVGWRALVRVSGQPTAIADVEPAVDSAEDVRQMTYGAVVSGITQLAEASQGGGADQGDDVDERILQIPGIYVVAIWEHNDVTPDSDVIVPAAPAPAALEEARRYSAAEFLARVAPLAAERLSADPTKASGSGSGTPPPR
jgi:hypothetical protein